MPAHAWTNKQEPGQRASPVVRVLTKTQSDRTQEDTEYAPPRAVLPAVIGRLSTSIAAMIQVRQHKRLAAAHQGARIGWWLGEIMLIGPLCVGLAAAVLGLAVRPMPIVLHATPSYAFIVSTLLYLVPMSVAAFLDRRLNASLRESLAVCPVCAHSLQGLFSSGRCPECGQSFQLAEVTRFWSDWDRRTSLPSLVLLSIGCLVALVLVAVTASAGAPAVRLSAMALWLIVIVATIRRRRRDRRHVRLLREYVSNQEGESRERG